MTDDSNNKYFLEEVTEKYGISIIQFTKKVDTTFHTANILKQLLKSGTSVGANYREANGAESKKDFIHKIAICKKEIKETEYWLKLLFVCNPEKKEDGKMLLQETKELILIFAKIHKSSQ